jgi:monoamine oxidase
MYNRRTMPLADRPFTRRAFLTALGAAGGAGAVLAAMEVLELVAPAAEYRVPFDPPRTSDFTLRGRVNNTRVLVLGAGIAGLTAAYELEKAGYRCEIIEARTRPGGRVWTVRRGTSETDLDGVTQTARFSDGLYMNAGAARIPQHHTTLDYCRELGVPIEPFANVNADAYVYASSDRGAAGRLADTPVRRRAAKADLTGGINELFVRAIRQGALDEELSAADAAALVDLLRALGALGRHDRYVGRGHRGYERPPGAGTQAGSSAGKHPLGDLLAARFGHFFPFEATWDQAMMMFQPVGGMDRIPHALADRIRGRIRYGAEVQGITTTESGVTAIVAEGGTTTEVSADYCVCTIPPSVLRWIPHNIAEPVATDIASLQVMPAGKLGLEFRRRFWEEDERIFGGITDTNTEIGTVWYPSSDYLTKRGIVIGAYNFADDSRAWNRLTPRQRTDRALDIGHAIHGSAYRDEFVTSFSAQWGRIRYSEGAFVVWPDRHGAYLRLLAPQGRLYFAGDHLSQVTAWQHGAFESARLVVQLLHRRVLNEAQAA